MFEQNIFLNTGFVFDQFRAKYRARLAIKAIKITI